MSRTNIDIDDELIAEVMQRYNLTTKKSAVELALRRLLARQSLVELVDSLAGIGWEDPGWDNEEMVEFDLRASAVDRAVPAEP